MYGTSDFEESRNLDQHIQWARTKLSGLREEHMRECDGSERCLQCRRYDNSEVPDRLGLASFEYRTKVAMHDVRQDGVLCVYCGGLAEQRDHLLPRSWTGDGVRRVVPTVPSCSDCNRRLSDYPEPVIAARAHLLAERIQRKHGKSLAIPDREEEYFLEFGEKMRQTQMARQFERQIVRARLIVLQLGGLPEVPTALLPVLTDGKYDEFLRLREKM